MDICRDELGTGLRPESAADAPGTLSLVSLASGSVGVICIHFLLLRTTSMQPGSLGQLGGVRMSILYPHENACIAASEQAVQPSACICFCFLCHETVLP